MNTLSPITASNTDTDRYAQCCTVRARVLIPSTAYKGQKPRAAVASGTMPNRPHQRRELSEIRNIESNATPRITRRTRSVFPMFAVIRNSCCGTVAAYLDPVPPSVTLVTVARQGGGVADVHPPPAKCHPALVLERLEHAAYYHSCRADMGRDLLVAQRQRGVKAARFRRKPTGEAAIHSRERYLFHECHHGIEPAAELPEDEGAQRLTRRHEVPKHVGGYEQGSHVLHDRRLCGIPRVAQQAAGREDTCFAGSDVVQRNLPAGVRRPGDADTTGDYQCDTGARISFAKVDRACTQ